MKNDGQFGHHFLHQLFKATSTPQSSTASFVDEEFPPRQSIEMRHKKLSWERPKPDQVVFN